MIEQILPYYRTKLNALGYEEHESVFDFTNIAENRSDLKYQLTWNGTGVPSQNLYVMSIDQPILISVFIEGFNDEQATRDRAILKADEIIVELLNHYTNNTTNVNNMTLNSFEILPISESNDNDMRIDISTTARVYGSVFC